MSVTGVRDLNLGDQSSHPTGRLTRHCLSHRCHCPDHERRRPPLDEIKTNGDCWKQLDGGGGGDQASKKHGIIACSRINYRVYYI